MRGDFALRSMLDDSEAWNTLLRTFPDWKQRLRFTLKWAETQPVTRHQYKAIKLVSGSPNIQAMVLEAAMPPRALLETLRSFVMAGLLEIDD